MMLKRIALSLALLLAPIPAQAIQAIGNGSVSVPVPPTQGGSGLTSAAAGCLIYASASNVFSCLPIGTAGQALTVSGSLPAWAAGGGGGPTLSSNNTWTGVNAFTNTTGVEFGTHGAYNASQILIANGRSGFGDAQIGSDNAQQCAGGIIAELLSVEALGDGIFCVNRLGNIGIGDPGGANTVSLAAIKNSPYFTSGLTVDNGNTTSYPWHPSSDPSCAIAAAGTSCSTTVTLPFSGMRCGASLLGTGTIGGIIATVAVSYSGTTETLTANAIASIAGGGTATFSESCT